MQIGLYDIDLWSGRKYPPNLELMKTYNYYHKRGDSVIMMTPRTDEARFDKIIYFKDHKLSTIPMNLSLSGINKSLCGIGFYGDIIQLPEEIAREKPTFLPYDSYVDKIVCFDYEKMRKSSIVRLSNNDFSGFIPEEKNIYVVDQKPLYSENLYKYLDQYKEYKFVFLHGLVAKDLKTYQRILPYVHHLFNKVYISFHYNLDILSNLKKNRSLIIGEKEENESISDYQKRIIKSTLCFKRLNMKNHMVSVSESNDFMKSLKVWLNSSERISYEQFYQKKQPYQNFIDISPARVLLKQDPLKFSTENIDFWEKT